MPRLVIVGSGFAGLGLAYKLKKAGIDDFIILEKSSGVGGTWRENTYPGAECDIASSLYSYSFAPNPGWDFKWSKQPQILSYICLLYTSPSPRDQRGSRMPSSA